MALEPMNESIVIRYSHKEIVAAQRARAKGTPQFWLIFGFGALATVVVFLLEYTVGIPRAQPVAPWVVPSSLGGIFASVFLLCWFVVPHLDAHFREEWKREYCFTFQNAGMLFGIEGQPQNLIPWAAVSKVVKSPLVYLLFLGSPMNFVILPKSELVSRCLQTHMGRAHGL